MSAARLQSDCASSDGSSHTLFLRCSLSTRLRRRSSCWRKHMAKVWFAKSGNEPTFGKARYDLPLSECIVRLGLKQSHFLSEAPPRFVEPSTSTGGVVTGPRHVVVEVAAS